MKLDARPKALALLYDHLVLERGVYDCLVGPGGAFSWVSPYHDPSQLKPVRALKKNFRVAAAPTGSDRYELVIDTPTEGRYRAQFESTLQQIAPRRPKWVSAVYFGVMDTITRAADDTSRKWMWEDSFLLTDFLPGASSFLRKTVIKSLYTDLARAFHLNVDIAPEGIHSTLIAQKTATRAVEDVATGERTLRLGIPNVAEASWGIMTVSAGTAASPTCERSSASSIPPVDRTMSC